LDDPLVVAVVRTPCLDVDHVVEEI